MGARLGHIENMLASHPYLAFSRAAHSPKANEDAFDAGYLSRAAPLTTETSFAFGMPDSQPGQVKDTPHWQQQAPTTTWDLLNFSEDLPPMADTIRQSFLPDQQVGGPPHALSVPPAEYLYECAIINGQE